jgi:signal transduction histidine kinase
MRFEERVKTVSLRTKFVALLCTVVLASALGQAWLGLWKGEKTLEAELTTRVSDLTRQLAGAVRYSTLTSDRERVLEAATAMVDQLDIVYVQVACSDGEVLATAGTWPSSIKEMPDALAYVVSGEQGIVRLRDRQGKKWLVCYAPVTRPARGTWIPDVLVDEADLYESHGAPPQRVGGVIACVSTERLAADLKHNLLLSFGILSASVMIGLVTLLMLLKFVVKPLSEVAEASRAVADGNLALRVPVRSSDEVGQLAGIFNQMAEALSESRAKLESYSHSLEGMVETRTEELKAKTEALEKANEELKELDRMKSGFISNVSHELRTPLTSIKATAEILAERGDTLPREQILDFLGIIENQTDRLTRLINDILDLSRLEHGGTTFETRPIPVTPIVHEALRSIQGLASERGINVSSNVPIKLPPALADRDGLMQVLMNLLSNALKFTARGGTISVEVNLLESRTPWGAGRKFVSGIVVSVIDSGSGIPADKLETIFDKFKQLENAAWGKPSGSGLGLAITREIVQQFGGAIWAESEVGKGSTFHFTLKPAMEDGLHTAVGAGLAGTKST